MIPIYLYGEHGRQGLQFDYFKDQLLEICAEHQRAGRASAFALILFDFTSPQLPRVLDDPNYWAALDAISGKALTVFSIHARLLNDITDRGAVERLGFYRETDRRTRQGLAKYFDLEAVPFPVLLFFQAEGDSVAASLFIGLKEQSVERAFNEIKELLDLAAKAVTDSAGARLRDPRKAFAGIEQAMFHRRIKTLIKSGAGVGMGLLEFVGSFLK